MPELLDKILCFADEYDMFPRTGLVMACVSGGADSMCLLDALCEISGVYGFRVCAAHFNHKLRGAESDKDEEFVKNHCISKGLPFYSGSGDVGAYASEHGRGIEEVARDLRYDFFYQAAAQASAARIATAHTADDNTETMILNLTRGSGLRGLGGIPPKRSLYARTGMGGSSAPATVIRPMLRVTKAEVLSYLNERGIPFVEDTTNQSVRFTRNRIRRDVIPTLRGINPRLDETAAAAAALARADEDYLSSIADGFIKGHCISKKDPVSDPDHGIRDPGLAGCFDHLVKSRTDGSSADISKLLELPVAVSSRVIRKLFGGNLSHYHIGAVLDLCRGKSASSMLSLPGAAVYREYGRIVFGAPPTHMAEGFSPVEIVTDGSSGSVSIEGLELRISYESVVTGDIVNKSFSSFLFKTLDICGKMTVRSRQTGDTIKLIGSNGTKSLKKLFIERRIPARARALVPVISDDKSVLAVYGIGAGNRAVPMPGDVAMQISFEIAQEMERREI